ncbi:DNA (cytosine-5-)-methyltransferase [Dysosmobacter sp.]|uniref:DNA (cytosine-5-)-methyltransferase n=1 Tax=Dysosmobacter sp. TaxID=2591382 RepID=UPI003AB5613C
MFAGVGGFRAGLTRVGGFQCVGHCEIDKYAEASYRAIHDIREEERYYPDARAIDPDELPPFDLLCGGFPCQAFSNAGKRRGFADARGTLFFEIARLVEARRPAYLLLENVPGLLTHDQGRTFAVILSALDDLGYLRRLILGREVKARPSQEIRALRTEIHHIGNNINQIARSVNAGIARAEDAKRGLYLLDQVYELMYEVAKK